MALLRQGTMFVLALWLSPAGAEPGFARLFKSQFGYQPSCNACHQDGGGSPLNAYGEQFKDAGSGLGAFAAVAERDADGDGQSNAAEIRARANPGSARSTVADPGDWLDTGNLIPREVQAAFSGIKAYKPLDAIFTADERARAAAMGVELTAADENTIYIPVDGRRPVGTAIIVPLADMEQPLFILVATDRQLNVTRVQAINPKAVSGADDSRLYADFAGRNIKELEPGIGESLGAKVATAVHKAGVILFVRLKKA